MKNLPVKNAAVEKAARWPVLLWLLAVLAAGAVLALRVPGGNAFVTDVLALLPAAERDALHETVAREMTARATRPLLIWLPAAETEHALAAARAVRETLDDSGLFAPLPPVQAPDLQRPPAALQALAPLLLADADRDALQRGDVLSLTERMGAALFSPVSVAGDPGGQLARFLSARAPALDRLQAAQGEWWLAEAEGARGVLLIAQLKASVFESDLLLRARDVLPRVRQQAAQAGAQAVMRGALLHAVAARVDSERDLRVVGSLSTVAVLAVLWLCFRSLMPMLAMLLVIGSSLLGGTALTLLCFPQVHVLTWLFGTTLIGIAGDYALHFLALRGSEGAAWQARAGMKRLLAPLTVAMLTTLLAYAAMALTGFSGLRQIAAFCAFGLLSGYLAVLALLPTLLAAPARHPPRGLVLMAAWQALLQPTRAGGRLAVRVAGVLLLLGGLGGLARVQVNDDVRLLQSPVPAVQADAARLDAAFAAGLSSQFFVLRAADEAGLREREEALRTALSALSAASGAGAALGGVRVMADVWPSPARLAADRVLLRAAWQEGGALAQAAAALGLPPEWRAERAAAVEAAPATVDGQALRAEWPWLQMFDVAVGGGETGETRASVAQLEGVRDTATLAALAVPGAYWLDRSASISGLFARWRLEGSIWVAAALAGVLVLLAWRGGPRRALRVAAPTVLAGLGALAALGWAGMPVNMFTSVGLLLVLGIGIDYALFLDASAEHTPASLLAMLLSAVTAISAFGLLAFASQPAVQGFGVTVAAGVSLALLLAPWIVVRPAPDAASPDAATAMPEVRP